MTFANSLIYRTLEIDFSKIGGDNHIYIKLNTYTVYVEMWILTVISLLSILLVINTIIQIPKTMNNLFTANLLSAC